MRFLAFIFVVVGLVRFSLSVPQYLSDWLEWSVQGDLKYVSATCVFVVFVFYAVVLLLIVTISVSSDLEVGKISADTESCLSFLSFLPCLSCLSFVSLPCPGILCKSS